MSITQGPPKPSYPQRVSLEGTHHSQKQGLLQESEEGTDQGLQAREAAKLCGGVPARTGESLSPQGPLSGFPDAPRPQPGPTCRCPQAATCGIKGDVEQLQRTVRCPSLDCFVMSSSTQRISLLDQHEGPGAHGCLAEPSGQHDSGRSLWFGN